MGALLERGGGGSFARVETPNRPRPFPDASGLRESPKGLRVHGAATPGFSFSWNCFLNFATFGDITIWQYPWPVLRR